MARDSTPPDPQALLLHAAWIRRLAGRLVAGSLADDVAQETLLAACAKPPHEGAELRGWLGTVARRIASRLRWREAQRRLREEAAARREALAPTDELVARAALERSLVDAVLALDEPWRTTVLMRWFDGRPPRAIARELGVPVETVRTRIKRALELLRERLIAERRHPDDAKGRRELAVLLFRVTTGAQGGVAGVGSAIGGLAMTATGKSIVMAAASVLVLAAVTWWATPLPLNRPRVGSEEVAGAPSIEPDDVPVDGARRLAADVSGMPTAPERLSIETSRELIARREIVVRLRSSFDDASIIDAAVVVRSGVGETAVATGRSGADGTASLSFDGGDDVAALDVAATHDRYFLESARIEGGQDSIDLQLDPKCVVRGEVDWEEGPDLFLGGTWGLFAVVGSDVDAVRRSTWVQHEAAMIDALRVRNEARFGGPPQDFIEHSHEIESRNGVRLWSVPIVGRDFQLDSRRIGEHCEFVLFLGDSEPVRFHAFIDSPLVDVGGIAFPCMAQLLVVVRAPDGSPVYPDPAWRAWCVRKNAAQGGFDDYVRTSALRSHDKRPMTYAMFRGRWREEYVVGLSGARTTCTALVRVPEGSELEEITFTVASRERGAVRATKVVDSSGKPLDHVLVQRGAQGSAPPWLAISGADGVVEIVSDAPDAVVRFTAAGHAPVETRFVSIEDIVTMAAAPQTRLRLWAPGGRSVADDRGRLLSFAQDGLCSEEVIDVRASEVVLHDFDGERCAALLLPGFAPVLVRESGHVVQGPDLELAPAVEVSVEVALQAFKERTLRKMGLMRSLVVRRSLAWDHELSFDTRLALDDRIVSGRIELRSSDEPVMLLWPRYRGGQLDLGSTVAREQGGGFGIEVWPR